MTPSKPLALLDGDVYLYRAAKHAEREVDWGEGDFTISSHAEEAQTKLDADIKKTLDAVGSDARNCVVALSDPSGHYFRHDIFPGYKGNRSSTRKPVGYKALRAYAEDVYTCKWLPKLEADDVLGILGTKPSKRERVICSVDKDMLTIPGRAYNPERGSSVVVSEGSAARFHLLQTLTGDSTDGYPGCPGVGAVGAEKFLDDGWYGVMTAFAHVVVKRRNKTSQKLDPPIKWEWDMPDVLAEAEEDALLQARLAYILRHGDYNMKTGEVKLWQPTK